MVFSFSSERGLRLPLALGVAAMMTTGSAAMAWPLLKEALVPAPRLVEARLDAQGGGADDRAAVAAFVGMTRSIAGITTGSQIAPEGGTPVAEAPAPDLDEAETRLAYTETGTGTGATIQPVSAVAPAPRPVVIATAPRTPRATPVHATPVHASPARAQSDAEARAVIRYRLLNRWSAGEFR